MSTQAHETNPPGGSAGRGRRVVLVVLAVLLSLAVGFFAGRSARGETGRGYPQRIHVTMPAREPGKFAERYELTVTSSNENGNAVDLGESNPDVPSARIWKIRLERNGAAPMVLFCEPVSR